MRFNNRNQSSGYSQSPSRGGRGGSGGFRGGGGGRGGGGVRGGFRGSSPGGGRGGFRGSSPGGGRGGFRGSSPGGGRGGGGRGGFRGGSRGGGFNKDFRGRGGGGSFRGGRGNPRHSFGNDFEDDRNNSDYKGSKSAPNTPLQKKFDTFTPKRQFDEDVEMDSGMNSEGTEDESGLSDENNVQETPAKGILKTPTNVSTTKKSVNISAAKSPSLTSKTSSTPHPASKKATAVVEPQAKHKLNFESDEDNEDESEDDEEESDEEEEESEGDENEQVIMAAKNASKKQGNAAVSGKTGKTAKLEETIAKGLAKGKGPENKPKLAFPTDSDEDEEMESDDDEVEGEDELEDEDEEMSEFSDEDEEESEDEQPQLNLVSKGAANQKSVTSGKSGKLASSSIVEKPVQGKKANQPVAQPSDSEEEDDEDEDEDEEESEDEQPPTKLPIKGVAKQNVAVNGKSGAVQGKTKQQVAPTPESDDEDDSDEEEDDDEEEESEDETPQTKVTSKAVAKQNTAVSGKTGKPATGVLEKSAQGKKQQIAAPALDSEEDDEDEEEEEASDEEDEEDEESEGEVEEPVAKKPKVAQTVKKPVAVVSPLEQSSIMKEEERRRQERNSRSLFIKGLPPKLTDSDLKALHSDIASVRRRKTVGWIIFNTKEATDKAKQKLSQLVLPGESKPLFVDYCDERSNKKPEAEKPSKAQTPINPLELVVINLPKDVKREQIKLVFKNAVNIATNKSLHNNIFKAFVRFDNEKDARDAFEKSKNLKIGGEPVDVFFTRIQTQGAKNQNLPKPQHGAAQKTQSKVGGNVEGKSPTTDEKKTAQPQKKSFDKSAAFKQGAPSGKSFPAKAKSFDSASKGTKRPFNQGSNKQKKPRL